MQNSRGWTGIVVSGFLTLLMAYSILAPVYWLPGVGFGLMAIIKGVLFVVLIAAAVLLSTSKNVRVPLGLWGLSCLPIMMLAALPGLMQTDSEGIARVVFDYALITFALLCGVVAGQVPGRLEQYLRWYLAATAVIAIAAIFLAPTKADATAARFGEEIVGFTTGRTAWSNGLALPAVLAASFGLSPGRSRNDRIFYTVCFVGIFAAQLAVGGRAGILAVVVAIIICAGPLRLYGQVRTQLMLAMVALGIGALAYANRETLVEVFRLDGYQRQGRSYIDNLSSGRIGTYENAWRLIRQRPWFGYGFSDWSESGNWGRAFVHNVWLKYLYQSGIPYFLMLVILKLGIFTRALKADRLKGGGGLVIFTPVIIAGLFIAMLEPNMLIGVFQKSAVWWFVGGIAIGRLFQHAEATRRAAETFPDADQLATNSAMSGRI